MTDSATILVADDDRGIRTVIGKALGRLGYAVRSTGTAATLSLLPGAGVLAQLLVGGVLFAAVAVAGVAVAGDPALRSVMLAPLERLAGRSRPPAR